MKKLFLFAAIAVFGFTSVNAQEVTFGAKAGLNLASVSGDNTDEIDGRTAFHVGAIAEIAISDVFSVQPELLYSAQGLTYKEECLNGLKTAKDSGLSVVQIRECQLLVQYLDSVVETRQYKADISQENYENAEAEWQEKQGSLENLKQELHKLEADNNDQDELIDDNRLTHKKSYKVYKQQK